MNLRDDLNDLPPKPGRCGVSKILANADPDFAAQVTDLVFDQSVDATDVAKVLRRRDYKVTDEAVQRHRRGACCQHLAA